ncbi:outer membrane lipoprotein carrier protein LolA [Vibrio ponticus]|nr:outer membrane lipoprotein carrier protein LolA [Vibrio ponticus]
MKKTLLLLLASFPVWATPQQELSERLQLTEGFSADFAQQVISRG